jgi:hypothetical protein
VIRRHCSEIVSRLTRFAQRGLRKLRERLRDVSRPSHKSYGLAGDLARHDKERSGCTNSPSMKFRILIFCGRADSKSSVTSVQHPALKIDVSTARRLRGSKKFTFSSKFPFAPAQVMVASLPITCAHTVITDSHMTRFTFPGMIELPGCVAGS